MARYITAVAALLVLAGGGAYIFASNHEAFSTRSVSEGVKRIKQCDNSIECPRLYIRDLLQNYPGMTLMDAFEEHFPPVACHTLGHITGQELYRTHRDIEKTMAACNSRCSSSCTHGIIGEAFVEELGISDSVDLRHLDAKEIRSLGQRLCSSLSTCHGVGHALSIAYDDPKLAIAACDEIASDARRTFCYRGIFMEIADRTSSGSIHTSEKPQASFEEIASSCSSLVREPLRACMRYLPRIYAASMRNATGEEKRDALVDLCSSFGDTTQQSACFFGMGVYYANYVYKNTTIMHDVCETLPHMPDVATCTLGMLSSAGEYRRVHDLLGYCVDITDATIRRTCYRGTFFTLTFLETSEATMESLRPLCEGKSECLTAWDLRHTDPWTEIVL